MFLSGLLLPDPAAMAGKDDDEADVEASAGGSRFGVPNASEGTGRLPDGGCWMVWRECPPSMEGKLGCPSKSYSSFTIIPELDPELFRVSPDKSVGQGKKDVEQVTDNPNVLSLFKDAH